MNDFGINLIDNKRCVGQEYEVAERCVRLVQYFDGFVAGADEGSEGIKGKH